MGEVRADVHGIGIRVDALSPDLQAAACYLLAPFPGPGDESPTRFILRLEDRPAAEDLPLGGLPSLAAMEADRRADRPWEWWFQEREGERCFLFPGRALLCIGEREGTLSVVQPGRMSRAHLRVLVRFALSEGFKRSGLYLIHAAAAERNGSGVLIPGESGAGKTTTLLALVRAGYRCLSDDHPLLVETSDKAVIMPYLAGVSVGPRTTEMYPELEPVSSSGNGSGEKVHFELESVYPGAAGTPAPVSLILFPEVSDAERCRLVPMPRSKALERLLSHAILTPDAAVTRLHFQALARAVAEAPCRRLLIGEDMSGLRDHVEKIIAAGR